MMDAVARNHEVCVCKGWGGNELEKMWRETLSGYEEKLLVGTGWRHCETLFREMQSRNSHIL